MPLTNFPNGVTSFGIPMVGNNMFGGDTYFVRPRTGLDGNKGDDPGRALKTIQAAHDKCTAGNNDVVYYISESTTSSASGTQQLVTAAITWTKSFTHLIGVSPPLAMSNRCRVGTTTAMTPMLDFDASSCIVKNFQFSQNHSHATAGAVCCDIAGSRNYFENVQFQNLGASAYVDNSCRALTITSGNGENRFVNCTFGSGTVDGGSATNYLLEFVGANQTARNVFENCYFLGNGSANSSFFAMATQSGGSAFQKFERCLFFNNKHGSLDEMTEAFDVIATCGCWFIMMDNLVWGAATYETTNSGLFIGRHAYAAATTDLGVVLTY
jgi:hypothetical protein